MIIVRTPLRLPIAGGGTDLPAWYEKHGSMFISAAINKYIYITLQHPRYSDSINLRYSEIENVKDTSEIKHDIIRETFKKFGVSKNVSLTSHADIPSGTGLGSSGSFGVSVVHALHPRAPRHFLARMATDIQMYSLGFPIGLQDQYAAAYGGFNAFTIEKNGSIDIQPLDIHPYFQKRLALFYTDIKRDANQILSSSSEEGLEKIQEIANLSRIALEKEDFDEYGRLLNVHWEYKKKRNPEISNPQIDHLYELGMKHGALGGKLIGAGGGGFMMFYAKDPQKLIDNIPNHEPFQFDYDGSKIIYENLC